MSSHKGSQPLSRRDALCRMGGGFGMMAFAEYGERVAGQGRGYREGSTRKLDFQPRAKRVIFLFMNGGLSQVDSFDPKPALDKYHGQPLPGGVVATERKTGALMRSPFTFKKYGQCGMDVSELFPHVGECADDICFIRSMYTDIPNHEPSMLMMNTGFSQAGRPCLGAWLTYGLGTENKNLPGFVVLCPDMPTTVGPPLGTPRSCPRFIREPLFRTKLSRSRRKENSSKRSSIRKADLVHSQRKVHTDRTEARTGSACKS